MYTMLIKLAGFILAAITFSLSGDSAPAFAWLGWVGILIIFLTNFFADDIQPRVAVHGLMSVGVVFTAVALFNIGTWWGWLGALLLFVVVEYDGEIK